MTHRVLTGKIGMIKENAIFICLSMVISLGLDVIRWDWIMTLVSNEQSRFVWHLEYFPVTVQFLD